MIRRSTSSWNFCSFLIWLPVCAVYLTHDSLIMNNFWPNHVSFFITFPYKNPGAIPGTFSIAFISPVCLILNWFMMEVVNKDQQFFSHNCCYSCFFYCTYQIKFMQHLFHCNSFRLSWGILKPVIEHNAPCTSHVQSLKVHMIKSDKWWKHDWIFSNRNSWKLLFEGGSDQSALFDSFTSRFLKPESIDALQC